MTWRLGPRAGRIFAQVSDGIAVVDRGWRVLHVNPEGARLLRHDADRLVGRVLWDAFPDAVGTDFWHALHHALAAQAPETVEAYYGPLDGWFEVRVFPAPEGLALYFRDVSERRAADRERQELIGRLSRTIARSEQLLGLTEALARALTTQEVADLVAAHARGALGCRFAGVALADEERGVMRYVSMAPLPEDVVRKWTEFPLDLRVPASDTARTGRRLLFRERSEIVAAYPDIADDLEEAGTHAMANLPLVASGRTIGALMATWSTPRHYDDDELRFLQTLAGQAAQAIERAQLFARERSIAATLQRAILPRRLPQPPGVAMAARYEPAERTLDVGGDWYDAFTLPGERLALSVGDVAGHGVEAAALMAQVRNAARAYADEGLEPGALLSRLNHLLAHHTASEEDPQLATVVFAVLDLRGGTLRWSNAGHPPPVVAGRGRGSRLLEAVHGPPLGVQASHGFAQAETRLAADVLLLYTDGLIEQRQRSLTDGLAALVDITATADLDDLDRFCDDVARAVLPRGAREDDMCLLAVRCSAPG